jgi:hypothetical protein
VGVVTARLKPCPSEIARRKSEAGGDAGPPSQTPAVSSGAMEDSKRETSQKRASTSHLVQQNSDEVRARDADCRYSAVHHTQKAVLA